MQQRWLCHGILSLAAIGAVHATASAQAWVPDKGQLGVSLDYNFSQSDKVVTNTSYNFDNAGSTTHQFTLAAEYIPIEKLAVNVSMPFMLLKYRNPGSFAHAQPGNGETVATYDDGSYHSTLTDLRVGARYQLLEDPVALTPLLAVSIPVADYETVGNTVAGRHLKQLHAGLAVGRIIGTASYVHLQYEFTLSEKYDRTSAMDTNHDIKKYSQNYSDIALVVGTKLLDYKLDLHLAAQSRIAHGGITFGDIFPQPVNQDGPFKTAGTANENYFHDAILKEDIFLLGGGIGYEINDQLSVSLDYRRFIDQIKLSQNTQNASTVALGLAWTPLN
ncbi:MAG TPA: hypothetical protein VGM90_31040 [Kofleriaceae bacterium]|jgi:hypothetical protein